MLVTYNWLKEFINFDIPVRDLADKLTSVGPEVVSIKQVGISKENSGKIVLAKITGIAPHPKSETLRVCSITASRNAFSVITNSRKIDKGHYVILALPGAKLPGGMEIKEAVIKGEKSDGMLLGKENLNLEEKSADVWDLGKEEKKAKSIFDNYTEEDFVMEIELTANRSDCLSVFGIAREVSAMLNKELNIPKPQIQENLEEIPQVAD